MQFVQHDAPERAEHTLGVAMAEQQRQLLGRRHQDVGRIVTLPGAAMHGRIAGPRLDLDACAHLADRGGEVAGDVDGQGLERRDIEGMQPLLGMVEQIVERRQETRERLAGACGSDQQRRSPTAPGPKHRELVLARRPSLGGEPVGNEWMKVQKRLV